MKMRNMLGLAAIGGLLYLHRRHGGEFTVESFRQSARDLWAGARERAQPLAEKAQGMAKDLAAEAREQARAAQEEIEDIGEVPISSPY